MTITLVLHVPFYKDEVCTDEEADKNQRRFEEMTMKIDEVCKTYESEVIDIQF